MSKRDQMTREQIIAISHIHSIIGVKSVDVISNEQHDRLMAAQAADLTYYLSK